MERYTCPRELLPVVEAALAAEGFTVEAPLQRKVAGVRVTVMTRGASVISLHEDAAHDMADINIYQETEPLKLAVLDELPRLVPTPIGKGRRR